MTAAPLCWLMMYLQALDGRTWTKSKAGLAARGINTKSRVLSTWAHWEQEDIGMVLGNRVDDRH